MRGDLSEKPAADVCRALAVDTGTGVLEIEGPDGRGSVVFRDGSVVAATSPTPRARLGDRLVNAGLLDEDALDEVLRTQARADTHQRLGAILVSRGLVNQDAVRLVAQEQVIDAVFDVLRWRYGGYRFEPGDLVEVSEVPLRIPVDQLLVEVARRQQEWAELERVIPDLDAVPTFRSGTGTAAASLEPDEFTVLASIDGARSVRELADDLGYGEFEAARIVYGLTLLGVVEVALPEDEVGRALEDALHELSAAPLAEPGPPDAPQGDPTAQPPSEPPSEPEPEPEPAPEGAGWSRSEPEPLTEPVTTMITWPDPVTDTEPGADADRADADRADEPPAVASDPEPDDEPPSPASLESPPGLVDVARLLAELEVGPADEPAGDDDAATDDPPEVGAEDGAEGESAPQPPPAPAARSGEDVSELLRELSRLALDEPGEPPGAEPRRDPPSTPRRPPADRDDAKRRRRLFGR